MRRIEIITPQHVTVTYQVASVRDRALAFLIDVIILAGTSSLISSLVYLSFDETRTIEAMLILLLSPVIFFYSFGFEVFTNGQSPGKIAIGVRVIKLNGEELTLSDYMLRWAFRWIDIWASIGSVAALQVSSSGKGQRLGDLLADTSVVKVQSDFKVNLKDLLAIKDNSKHEVMYPEVAQMTEAEMLMIKVALDQAKKFKNKAHFEVLESCAENLTERLNLPRKKQPAEFLLNRLLVDYVTITRSA